MGRTKKETFRIIWVIQFPQFSDVKTKDQRRMEFSEVYGRAAVHSRPVLIIKVPSDTTGWMLCGL